MISECEEVSKREEGGAEKGRVGGKRLILIRHAESQNNVDKREAYLAYKNMTTLQGLPSLRQVCSAGRLLTIPMDSELSAEGVRMLARLKEKLIEMNVLRAQGVEVILHSHLIRARRTCYGLFSSDNGMDVSVPILENSRIYEKNIPETLSITDMKVRVEEFKEYLIQRKEECIVIVGHSAFFRSFLDTTTKLKNCEVGVVSLDEDGKCCGSFEIIVEGGQALLDIYEEENEASEHDQDFLT